MKIRAFVASFCKFGLATFNMTITSAFHASAYKVQLTFSDGTKQTIDFQYFLKKNTHPQFSPYLDLKKFKKFRIERGNIVWGKDWDLIFPVEELYAGKLTQTT